MNRTEREKRKQNGQPEVPGSTRRTGESRRAQRRRLAQRLPVYKSDGGNSGSNIGPGQQYAENTWSGTGFCEG